MLDDLRQKLHALERPALLEDSAAVLPLGVPEVDAALGGGFSRGALHEIAAVSEAHLPAATGFVAGVARAACAPSPRLSPSFRDARHQRVYARLRRAMASGPGIQNQTRSKHLDSGFALSARPGMTGALVWIAEDLVLAESGVLYGPGFDGCGIAPERLLTVCVAHRRELLWAMEEALRCRSVSIVVGELRAGNLDAVAVRRLSLAAAETGALALLLRAAPPEDASTAATRWIVGAALQPPLIPAQAGIQNGPSTWHVSAGSPLSRGRTGETADVQSAFTARLVRNRRGPLGSWILTWSDDDGFAAHAQPLAVAAGDRPHRAVA